MKILITGAAGFVGSTLARFFKEADPSIEIHGLDNLIRPGSHLNVSRLVELGVQFRHGDIRNASDLEGLPEVDWVIDAAANASVLAGVDGKTSSRQLIEHNLAGTINMMEYCKQVGAGFILLSTSRVYSIPALAALRCSPVDRALAPAADQDFPHGISEYGIAEDYSTQPPVSLYGSTKIASEYLALEYGESFGLPVWVNRCGVMAGAGQFGHPAQGIFAFWVHSFAEKSPLKYIGFGGHGHQVRDCLQPRDLGQLILKQIHAGNRKDAPRTINVSGGLENSMSLRQLSDWCSDRFAPMEVTSTDIERPFDIGWMVLDNRQASKVWDWQVQTPITSVLEEIAVHAETHPDWLSVAKA